MNEPYGRFEAIVELPTQLPLPTAPITLAVAPTEAKFPWKWVIIGGLAFFLVTYLIGRKDARKY